MSGTVQVRSGWVRDLLKNATTVSSGNWQFKDAPKAAYQATVSGTGTVTATITLEVSNDATFAVATLLGTITLTGTTSSSDGFTTDAPWKYVRAAVTAITGTGATVNVTMSV